MTWWDYFSFLKAVFVLNVLMTSTLTSGQEASQQVMYVTGCLGSNSVMLHQMTSSDADVRAVFVYKGGEILGSDIIPAQGDYKGRLQISRQGDVTLSDLRLWDSGVFRIELTMRDSKTSTYVVLVVPEAPVVADGRLLMYRAVSSSHQEHVRLACGTFSSLGYPAASVLWLDPEGRLLSSTGYMEGQYFLDLPPSSPSGNYSCLLHCSQPHTCCLPSGSPLSQHATVHIHTSPTPPTLTSHPTPELTSALEQAGENMAAGMAALVNEQMQDSFETSSEKLEVWKEELEQKMEKRFREMSIRLEKVLEDRFEEMEGDFNSDGGRGFEAGAKISLADTQKIFERDVYSKMKNSIQILYRQVDEGRKNMSDFQKKTTNKLNSFQRKLKSLRLSMKRHGVYKHDRAIRNLVESTDKQFKDIHEKLADLETSSQPSDQLLQNFQTRLSDMGNKLTQGEVSLGSFQRSITRKMEDLREQVTGLDNRFRRHESSHHRAAGKEEQEPDDSSNDTKAVLGRTSRPEVSQRREYPYSERRQPYGRGDGEETGDSASVSYDNAPVSETCVAAMRKGGTVSGVYTLRPDIRVDPQPFWCDMDTDGGGWIVVQRRQDGSEDFFRPWDDYVQGFGDPHGEFWLGLDNLHYITTGADHSLRVELRTYSDVRAFALYQTFRVLGPHHNYLMSVSGYSGTAGDGLFVHDGQPFSTWNRDHDAWADGHCAANYRSAWWYAKCRVCDLNAPHTNQSHGIMWLYGDDVWGAGKVKFVEMKIRPEQ